MIPVHYRKRIWSKIQKTMPIFMIVSMGLLAFVPPVSGFTQTVFLMFWSSVLDGSYTWAVPAALVALYADVKVNTRLEMLKLPWLEKSFFSAKGNVAYSPVKYKWLGFGYIALLAYCMPILAFAEEAVFRELASQLGVAMLLLISGPIFGVIHMLSGANVRRAICTSAMGLAMAGIYLAVGLMGVFVFHASYNLIVNGWVLYDKLRLKLRLFAPTSSGDTVAIES